MCVRIMYDNVEEDDDDYDDDDDDDFDDFDDDDDYGDYDDLGSALASLSVEARNYFLNKPNLQKLFPK